MEKFEDKWIRACGTKGCLVHYCTTQRYCYCLFTLIFFDLATNAQTKKSQIRMSHITVFYIYIYIKIIHRYNNSCTIILIRLIITLLQHLQCVSRLFSLAGCLCAQFRSVLLVSCVVIQTFRPAQVGSRQDLETWWHYRAHLQWSYPKSSCFSLLDQEWLYKNISVRYLCEACHFLASRYSLTIKRHPATTPINMAWVLP